MDIFSSDNLRGLEGGILRGLDGRERERWLSLIFSITPAVIFAPSRLFLVMILFNNQIVYYNCPVANSINNRVILIFKNFWISNCACSQVVPSASLVSEHILFSNQ